MPPHRAGGLHADARRRRSTTLRGRSAVPVCAAADGGGRAGRARSRLPDGGVPEPRGAGGDGSARWRWPRTRASTSRWPTTPMPTASRWPCPTDRRRLAGADAATRSVSLLADHLLRHGIGADRLVVTTVVSSSMLATMAAAHGVDYVETLTGFKWLARAGLARPELRFVVGYEEALGYSVGGAGPRQGRHLGRGRLRRAGRRPRAPPARRCRERLDELAVEFGVHRTQQWSTRFEGLDGPSAWRQCVARLRAAPPASIGGRGDHRGRGPGPGWTAPADRRRHPARRRAPGGRPALGHRAQAEGLRRGRRVVESAPATSRRRPGRAPPASPTRCSPISQRCWPEPARLDGQAVPKRRSPASPRPGHDVGVLVEVVVDRRGDHAGRPDRWRPGGRRPRVRRGCRRR